MKQFLSTIILASLCCGNAMANDINDAALNMCEHMKVCVKKNIDAEELTPAMSQMMDAMVNNMCTSIIDIGTVMAQPKLGKAAVDCLNSITTLSCEQLEDDISTPQCKEYEALAEEYYPSSQ